MKKIFFSLALLLVAVATFAQNNGRERIKAQKVAYITDQLALTSDEAADFWPVYNSFAKREKELRKNHKRNKGNVAPTDAEAEKMIYDKLDMETQLLNLKKERIAALKRVLPPSKIVQLYQAEKSFKKQVLRASRGKKGGRR